MGETVTYLKKFKIAIFIVVVAIAAVVLLIKQTIPEFQKIKNLQDTYKTQTDALADTERKLTDLNETVEKERAEDKKIIKAFFKPTDTNVDTETAITEEFNEILQILRENKIKTRSLRFDPDPSDDTFVQHASERYFVSRMDAEMIATYSDFESFLRDLYKHEHFLDISKIKIVPYQKNKRILLIDIQIKLYAEKGEGSISTPTSSAPQPTSENSNEVQQPPREQAQNQSPQQNAVPSIE